MYKILLVADTHSVTDELASALGSINYEFIMVDDGRNTRDAVKTHLPDLVIVDMQVGSMSGMAICLDLRLEESGGRLPSSKVLMIVDRRVVAQNDNCESGSKVSSHRQAKHLWRSSLRRSNPKSLRQFRRQIALRYPRATPLAQFPP